MMINYGSKHHHHHESCQPSADRGRRGAQVERKVGRDTDDALEHTRDMPDEIHQS